MGSTRWKTPCLYLFILFSIFSPTSQNSRQKREIIPDQPRIITQNGHLVFQTGTNHDITFKSINGGKIKFGDSDVTNLADAVTKNKNDIDQLKNAPTHIPDNVGQRLTELTNRLDNLQPTGTVATQLTSLRNDLTTYQNAVPTTVNTRLSAVENSLNLPTGAIKSQLNTITSRISAVERRTRRRGPGRSSSRIIRRLTSRVNTLRTTVNQLQALLTNNECNSNPCRNGGTCLDLFNGFICKCPNAWQGNNCETDVNECSIYAGTDMGCQNGATCTNTPGSFSCHCAANWHGIRCTESHDDCTGASQSELCGHGTCVNVARVLSNQPKYKCICDDGWTKSTSSPACTVDIDECSGQAASCSRDPPVQCINIPGSFRCGVCPTGYTGNGFTCQDINECLTGNGGCSQAPRVECINTRGSRRCGACPSGYQGNGVTCNWVGVCNVNNGGCYSQATCRESPGIAGRTCTCPAGYAGNGVGNTGCIRQTPTVGPCATNPCQHGGACQLSGTAYICICNAGYTGRNCESDVNECLSNPCQNGGTCVNSLGSFSCQCSSDYTGPTCQQTQQSCGGTLRGETGSLSYPRTTGANYPHAVSCAWVIETTAGKVLTLTFTRFDLEAHQSCSYDYLQIHDGGSASTHMIGKYCGTALPNGGSLNSTHNQLYLWFYSDASVAGNGFTVSWTSGDPSE
ncbi:cubilin-like [Patella vulgata]|uniref:cubilin-like n=1 Tax=Patella vulgata TaxID=6465 RepID=UPI0024A7B492|nr:cubilin-like [Patella vulgata]